MKKLACYGFSILLLTGCGEFAYKRGATAQDLENTKKECRSENASVMEACLERHGWLVHQLDDTDLFADTSPIESVFAEDATSGQMESTPTKSVVESNDKKVPAENSKKETRTPKESNPYETFKISSWWKMGSSEKELKSHMTQCGEKLGAEHSPVTSKQLYTKGFILCMGAHGWKALRMAH